MIWPWLASLPGFYSTLDNQIEALRATITQQHSKEINELRSTIKALRRQVHYDESDRPDSSPLVCLAGGSFLYIFEVIQCFSTANRIASWTAWPDIESLPVAEIAE